MTDFHTHNIHARDAIISLTPGKALPIINTQPDVTISVGIHPWESDKPYDLKLLRQIASCPQVIAIGETGLDTLRGAPIEQQISLFEQHIQLSQELSKPLIIHCVKAWDKLLALHKKHHPHSPWGIHGFRGNPALARQLTDAGLYISLGQRFNPDTAATIPDNLLLVETDESQLPITTIANLIDTHRHSATPFARNLATFLHHPTIQ